MNAKLQLLKRKLSKILSRTPPEDFFAMIWSMRAIQCGELSAANYFKHIPKSALEQKIDSESAIHPWELETLTNLYLQTKSNLEKRGKHKITDCKNFNAIKSMVNLIRDIENEQYGITQDKKYINYEMTRIGYRQFAWQRNYVNSFQLYRNMTIFLNPEVENIFREKYGFELKKLFLFGFLLYSLFRTSMSVQNDFDFSSRGISAETSTRIFEFIAISLNSAKSQSKQSAIKILRILGHDNIAYRDSILRRRPLLSFDETSRNFFSPIPDFIIIRSTEGIYYDLISIDSHRETITNSIGRQFEIYCRVIFEKWNEDCQVTNKNGFRLAKKEYGGVDLICTTEKSRYLIECKASRLTLKQQYSSFFDERSSQFKELAKGVLQLWRQMSSLCQTKKCYAVLLTYDRWLFLNEEDRIHLYSEARTMAGNSIDDLNYKGNVILCTIEDIEICLSVCGSEQLNQLFDLALEDRFNGHIVSVLLDRIVPDRKRAERRLLLSLADFGSEWDFSGQS